MLHGAGKSFTRRACQRARVSSARQRSIACASRDAPFLERAAPGRLLCSRIRRHYDTVKNLHPHSCPMATIITLTTDFGTADGFVGAMKGVILEPGAARNPG